MSIKKSLEWYTQSCFGDFRGDGIIDFFSSLTFYLYFIPFLLLFFYEVSLSRYFKVFNTSKMARWWLWEREKTDNHHTQWYSIREQICMGFLHGSAIKNPSTSARGVGFIPGSGKSSGSGITSHPKDRPLDGLPHFQALSSLAHPPCCPFSLSTSVAVSSLACIFQCNTARADPRAWPLPALGPATTLLRPPHLPCSQKMPFHLSTPLFLLLPPDQHSFLTSYSFSKV